jgi:hypothetical protein
MQFSPSPNKLGNYFLSSLSTCMRFIFAFEECMTSACHIVICEHNRLRIPEFKALYFTNIFCKNDKCVFCYKLFGEQPHLSDICQRQFKATALIKPSKPDLHPNIEGVPSLLAPRHLLVCFWNILDTFCNLPCGRIVSVGLQNGNSVFPSFL